jgi:hypothetical protein
MADPTSSVTVATPDPAAATAAPSVAPVAAAAPAPPTAPDIAVPAPAPVDVTSGAPQPNRATAVQGSMQPYIDKAQAASQKAADLANTPIFPASTPHSRLLNIVAAIGAGLSGAGTAIATHGREGGAEEVQQIMGARQQQQIAKQQAATAQRDAQIRQQQTIAETNMNLANNVMLMASLPAKLTKDDLDIQTEAQELAKSKADFAAAHGGMSADEFTAALNGTGPATGPLGGQVNPFFKTTADQQYQAAVKILGQDDPFVQALGKTLANPNATPNDLWTATTRVQSQQALQEKATDAQTKRNQAMETAPFGADKAAQINGMMEKRYQVLHPNQPLPDEYKVTADSTPKDFDRADKILQQSENAAATQAQRDTANSMREAVIKFTQGGGQTTGDASKQGNDYLQSLPAGRRSNVTAIGEGRVETNSNTFRTPAGQSLLADVTQAYPDYDQSKAQSYFKMRNDFTSGTTSTGINSYNTAIMHLGAMYDTVKNANLVDLNNPASAINQKLAQDKNFVSSELAKAVSNGQMTEGEKDQMEASIGGKIAGVAVQSKYLNQIQNAVTLLQGKLTSYQNQWENGMPSGAVTPVKIVSPDAQATLDRISGRSQQTPTAPAGATHTAKGSDGHLHYTNGQGQDLGIVPGK